MYGDGTRRCTTCKVFLPLAKFHKYKQTVQGSCIECTKVRKITHREKIRELLYAAKSVPCMDCGHHYPPYVMDFDHMRDKKYLLSRIGQLGHSIDTAKKEMAKCEVVCANCHRIRTFTRRGQ